MLPTDDKALAQSRRRSAGRLQPALLALATLLGIWTANALYVLSTVSAHDARTVSSSDEQHAQYASWWGRFNRDLRASMAAVDHAMDIPPRRQNFSFWLFIGLPGLISIVCLVKALPTSKAKTAPRISGEVTWPRTAFDPNESARASIGDLIQVAANLVQTGGPPNGTYDVLTPIAVAKLGKPYRKFEHLIAVPFSIDGLPLDTEFALDCAVAKELQNHSPEGVRLGGTIHSSRITLTGETPTAADITLKLSCFDR